MHIYIPGGSRRPPGGSRRLPEASRRSYFPPAIGDNWSYLPAIDEAPGGLPDNSFPPAIGVNLELFTRDWRANVAGAISLRLRSSGGHFPAIAPRSRNWSISPGKTRESPLIEISI